MSVGNKKRIISNILAAVLCQFEACAKLRSQAVTLMTSSINDTRVL